VTGLAISAEKTRMNMPMLKAEVAAAIPAKTNPVLAPGVDVVRPPTRKPGYMRSKLLPRLSAFTATVLPPLVTLSLILLLWELLCNRPGATLPAPSKIWTEAKDLILDPFFVAGPQDIGLGWRVLTSLQRVAIGYGLAGLIGIALGTIIGQSVWAMRGLDPIFQVLRTISPLAWLPISLAAFRDSQPSAIFVIFITSVWPIIINTAVGIRNIPQDYRNVALVLRLNPLEFFAKIMIPSAAPYIFTGLRIGIGLSWLAIVAAEMLTGGVGIGFFIWDAWNSSRLSDIVVALVYIGGIGFILDRLVAMIATFVTRGTAAN
jgi:nitrate/nitrite transport system permease protein